MKAKEGDDNGGTVTSEASETWQHSRVEEFIRVPVSRRKRGYTICDTVSHSDTLTMPD